MRQSKFKALTLVSLVSISLRCVKQKKGSRIRLPFYVNLRQRFVCVLLEDELERKLDLARIKRII